MLPKPWSRMDEAICRWISESPTESNQRIIQFLECVKVLYVQQPHTPHSAEVAALTETWSLVESWLESDFENVRLTLAIYKEAIDTGFAWTDGLFKDYPLTAFSLCSGSQPKGTRHPMALRPIDDPIGKKIHLERQLRLARQSFEADNVELLLLQMWLSHNGFIEHDKEFRRLSKVHMERYLNLWAESDHPVMPKMIKIGFSTFFSGSSWRVKMLDAIEQNGGGMGGFSMSGGSPESIMPFGLLKKSLLPVELL
jgi:hypothetical protein